MAKMREQLMSKNVASEVANDITASVQATLINQRLKSFTRYRETLWDSSLPCCPTNVSCCFMLFHARVEPY